MAIIVPATPLTWMLATLEAIIGQLFLTVLVARLVGMHIVASTGKSREDEAEM